MALEKIDFEVEIPEQIIVVDTNTMKSDVVRRGKLIKPVGGRKTASDEEDDQLVEEHLDEAAGGAATKGESTSHGGVANKKASERKGNNDEAMTGDEAAADSSEATPRSTKVRFAEVEAEVTEPETDSTPVIDIPARQASRINLALARNMSFRDINIRDINPQDNIVVNACSVKVSPNRLALALRKITKCDVINCKLKKKKSKTGALPAMSSAPLCHLQGKRDVCGLD